MRLLAIVIYFTLTSLTLSSQIAQGPFYPDSIKNDNSIGNVKWVNPINAADSDKLYAIAADTGSGIQSNYLVATHFHFAIPGTAIIKGILVEVLGHYVYFGPPGPPPLKTSYVSLVKNDTIQKTTFSNVTLPGNNDKYWIPFGGDTSMWNDTALRPADINNPNFGVAYSVLFDKDSIFINSIRITVYYTNPAGVEDFAQSSYSEIHVFPNPSNGIFQISIQNNYGDNKIEVFSMMGDEIFSRELNPNSESNQIDLHNQPQGVYLYRIISGKSDQIAAGKLLIQ